MKKKLTAAAAFMMVMGMAISASAAYDENLNNYTLDTVVEKIVQLLINLVILLPSNPTIVLVVT